MWTGQKKVFSTKNNEEWKKKKMNTGDISHKAFISKFYHFYFESNLIF